MDGMESHAKRLVNLSNPPRPKYQPTFSYYYYHDNVFIVCHNSPIETITLKYLNNTTLQSTHRIQNVEHILFIGILKQNNAYLSFNNFDLIKALQKWAMLRYLATFCQVLKFSNCAMPILSHGSHL